RQSNARRDHRAAAIHPLRGRTDLQTRHGHSPPVIRERRSGESRAQRGGTTRPARWQGRLESSLSQVLPNEKCASGSGFARQAKLRAHVPPVQRATVAPTYSGRIASTGSIAAARRAGSHDANSATASNPPVTASSVGGSSALT